MLDTGQENGEDYAMSSATEDESIKSFRSALMQSANTLNELTKLRITEHRKDAVKNVATTECDTHALFVNTASIGEHAAEDDITDQR